MKKYNASILLQSLYNDRKSPRSKLRVIFKQLSEHVEPSSTSASTSLFLFSASSKHATGLPQEKEPSDISESIDYFHELTKQIKVHIDSLNTTNHAFCILKHKVISLGIDASILFNKEYDDYACCINYLMGIAYSLDKLITQNADGNNDSKISQYQTLFFDCTNQFFKCLLEIFSQQEIDRMLQPFYQNTENTPHLFSDTPKAISEEKSTKIENVTSTHLDTKTQSISLQHTLLHHLALLAEEYLWIQYSAATLSHEAIPPILTGEISDAKLQVDIEFLLQRIDNEYKQTTSQSSDPQSHFQKTEHTKPQTQHNPHKLSEKHAEILRLSSYLITSLRNAVTERCLSTFIDTTDSHQASPDDLQAQSQRCCQQLKKDALIFIPKQKENTERIRQLTVTQAPPSASMTTPKQFTPPLQTYHKQTLEIAKRLHCYHQDDRVEVDPTSTTGKIFLSSIEGNRRFTRFFYKYYGIKVPLIDFEGQNALHFGRLRHSTHSALKGKVGEASVVYALTVLEKDPWTHLPSHYKGNQGIDGVFVRYDAKGNIRDILLIESKNWNESNPKSRQLKFDSENRQAMSKPWVIDRINQMIEHGSPGVQQTGHLLLKHLDKALNNRVYHLVNQHYTHHFRAISDEPESDDKKISLSKLKSKPALREKFKTTIKILNEHLPEMPAIISMGIEQPQSLLVNRPSQSSRQRSVHERLQRHEQQTALQQFSRLSSQPKSIPQPTRQIPSAAPTQQQPRLISHDLKRRQRQRLRELLQRHEQKQAALQKSFDPVSPAKLTRPSTTERQQTIPKPKQNTQQQTQLLTRPLKLNRQRRLYEMLQKHAQDQSKLQKPVKPLSQTPLTHSQPMPKPPIRRSISQQHQTDQLQQRQATQRQQQAQLRQQRQATQRQQEQQHQAAQRQQQELQRQAAAQRAAQQAAAQRAAQQAAAQRAAQQAAAQRAAQQAAAQRAAQQAAAQRAAQQAAQRAAQQAAAQRAAQQAAAQRAAQQAAANRWNQPVYRPPPRPRPFR